MKRNKIIALSAIVIVVSVVFLVPKFSAECDYADGGFRAPGSIIRHASCSCRGIKIGSDQRPYDGGMSYRCLGLVTAQECEIGEITENYSLKVISNDCSIDTSDIGQVTQSEDAEFEIQLGARFQIGVNQTAFNLPDFDRKGSLSLKVVEFYNNPCPSDAQCFWSGLDVYYEFTEISADGTVAIYTHPGNINDAHYQVSMVESDYKTKATFIVEQKDLTETQTTKE